MNKYEYKIISVKLGGNQDCEEELNNMGKDGWELTVIKYEHDGNERWYFKRVINHVKNYMITKEQFDALTSDTAYCVTRWGHDFHRDNDNPGTLELYNTIQQLINMKNDEKKQT